MRFFKFKATGHLGLPAVLLFFLLLLVPIVQGSASQSCSELFNPYIITGEDHQAVPQAGQGTVASTSVDAAYPQDSHPVSLLNDRARDITGATAVNAPGFVVPEGLTGEGQIVAIADSGLDMGRMDDIHPDLQSVPGKMPKVVLLKSWAGRDMPDDPDGHGTHMAATIAGTGTASNGRFKGVAPGASIYFQAILNQDGKPEPPVDLADLFGPAYSAGARVHVNGWGGGQNTYLATAAQIDGFVREHPEFLAIFGAGNSGPSAGTVTGEANSKNALAVGASVLPRPAFVFGAEDTALTADFSSRGPAGDGRIKPELLAPASAVISACSRLVEGNLPGFPDYTRLQGTSMAAAVTGGEAVLLREYLKKHIQVATPSAALVKAVLINGSRPAAGGPSKGGFGIIDLAGMVTGLKEEAFLIADEWAGVPQDGEVSYTFHVVDSSAPFKATLAWTDPPAESGCTHALVNDLNLVVRTPDGRVYYGNHFLGANTPDRTNNVEQVYLPAPVPGEYTVQVKGAGVRQNTVRGSAAPAQDYALAWGQAPLLDTVRDFDGQSLVLAGGRSITTGETPVVNLVNDSVVPVDAGHIFPGGAVYQTQQRAYLVTRLWRAVGVKALQTAEGTVFTEINQSVRAGGYSLAPGAAIRLNNSPAGPGELPPGLEIHAAINPVDQKIHRMRATFVEREGVVVAIRHEDGEKKLTLAGDRGAYRISSRAAYSYEDILISTDTADTPFGTGALDELEEVLPGMPVRLHLAPSTGEVQYLTVKRRVALGTVREITADKEIRMKDGTSFRVFPGVPVKRDRETADLDAVKPGDHIAAVLLPDTGEAIGLVAYSSILYGKAIDFTRKNRTLYLLDDSGRYRSLYLPPDAVIYRWGIRATADAIATGCRIRVTTDFGGKEVWRLDIAETFYTKGALDKYDRELGIVVLKGGERFRLAESTRFYKNGHPVLPEDILPGGQVEVEYAIAPPPTGNVLVSVNTRTVAPPPLLQVSAVSLPGRVVVSGRTGADNSVYIWEKNASSQVTVDAAGRFSTILQYDGGEGLDFEVVAVDKRSGGIAGDKISIPAEDNAGPGDTAAGTASAILERVREGDPGGPLTRVQVAATLARLLHWPETSEWPLTFADTGDIPGPFRPAVAEAQARGIINGYPGDSFLPHGSLSRAETAVILAAVLRDLGLQAEVVTALSYTDEADIPCWAVPAVTETTAAGLFHGRMDGTFAPLHLVTAEEMAILLERLMECCRCSLS